MLPFIQLLQHRTARPLVRFAHLCVSTIAAVPTTIYDHAFIFVLKGSGIVSSEGKQAAYKEGSVIMIPPGVAYSLTQEQEEEEYEDELHIAIHFDWEPQVQAHEELLNLTDNNQASGAEAEEPHPAPNSIWLAHVAVLESASDELFACAGWTLRAYEQGGVYQRLRTDAEMLNLIVQLVENITDGAKAIQTLQPYENGQVAAVNGPADLVN